MVIRFKPITISPVLLVGAILATTAITYFASKASPPFRTFYPGDLANNERVTGFYVNKNDNDLNNDGVNDLIIELENGRRIPMYGIVMGDGKIHYFGQDYMKRHAKNEYSRIEKELNK